MIIPSTIVIIFDCFGTEDPMMFGPLPYFGGLAVIALVVFYYFRLGKKRNLLKSTDAAPGFETDILGQPKSTMADRSDYKTIDGVLNWRYILLALLLFLGLALIYSNRVQYQAPDPASAESIAPKSGSSD